MKSVLFYFVHVVWAHFTDAPAFDLAQITYDVLRTVGFPLASTAGRARRDFVIHHEHSKNTTLDKFTKSLQHILKKNYLPGLLSRPTRGGI